MTINEGIYLIILFKINKTKQQNDIQNEKLTLY